MGLERGIRVLTRIANDGNRREDGDRRFRLDDDFEKRAVFRSIDGHNTLIRVYVKEGLALFDALADLLVPCDKTAFVLRKAKLRHNNNLCHSKPLLYTNFFTASRIIFSFGTTSFSSTGLNGSGTSGAQTRIIGASRS